MRPTNSNDSGYQPASPPTDPTQLPRYLLEEFNKIKVALDAGRDGFDPVCYAEPPKPRDGMRRNADGMQWNPGSGRGLYRYDGATSAWKLLG